MQVRLANKLPQSVTVSVRGADGKLSALNLPPFATSEPMDEDALDTHARQLVAAGHLKVRKG